MNSKITRLSLNDLPSDLDFEDYISAHLLLGGYTLDRSIHEKIDGAGDLFEVDIVTHKYERNDIKRLVEIKSRRWDLSDLFKVGGRLRYLKYDSGAFVVQQKEDDKKFPLWQSSSLNMDVALIYAGKKTQDDVKFDLTELYENFEIDNNLIDNSMLEAIRFSYIAERCMKARISQLNKTQQTDGLKALWSFSNSIQDISFYDDDPIRRLHKTFELFIEFNHLSARLDHEWLHGSFPDPETVSQFENGRVKRYLLYDIKYMPVEYSMYLEHRLRMYIIQSCVEYLVMPREYQNEFDEFLKDMSYQSLSSNITSGIDFMYEKCPNYRAYPRLWQLFTYLMGGFILSDHYDEEIGLLSNLTGVPKDEVELCFAVYDVLFPTTSSRWLREIGNTHIMRMNFFPVTLMGIGANFRRYLYRVDVNNVNPPYEDLKKKLSNDFTYGNLMKWNQAAFELLMRSEDLKKS